jgi:two-component system heavy metal sensor histidine kinase CusS
MRTEPRSIPAALPAALPAASPGGGFLFHLRSSLRLRLAITFALGTMMALVAVSGFTYWAFRREIRIRDQRLLDGRVQEVAAVLLQGNLGYLEDEVLGHGAASTNPQIWVRVREGERLIIESRDMTRHLPPTAFGGAVRARAQGRLYTLKDEAVAPWHIQGAMDVTEDELLILRFRQRLLYGFLLGSSLCALFGWWAANRGLRPIRRLEATTRTINANHLRERLEPAEVPQELGNLVHALNDMLDRLDQAFSKLSQFSADLAHELRTPITNLMGEAEVALSSERSKEDYKQVLVSSLEEFRRLSRLITRMLFLARTEDPQTAIKHGAIDPRKLVEDVLAFFEASAEEQGVRLEGHGEGALRGDAELLRQALANLVSNALEATPPGGAIQVGIRPVPLGIELEVRDTGRGIPAEELPIVCDRFARTRASLDGKAVGTGLGLPIVRSIALLHGGDLAIASEPGKGTVVQLLLPTQP